MNFMVAAAFFLSKINKQCHGFSAHRCVQFGFFRILMSGISMVFGKFETERRESSMKSGNEKSCGRLAWATFHFQIIFYNELNAKIDNYELNYRCAYRIHECVVCVCLWRSKTIFPGDNHRHHPYAQYHIRFDSCIVLYSLCTCRPTAYHSYIMVEKGSGPYFSFSLPQSSSRIKMNSKPKIVFFYVKAE